MLIILALCIPVTALVTGFFVLQAVRMGLQWQMEIKKEQTPSPVIKNPIEPIIEAKQQEKQKDETVTIFNEWLNGSEESR